MQKSSNTDEALSSGEAARLFVENFVEAQYSFVEFFCDHLAACARAFDGDLQKPLILALVGQAHLVALRKSVSGDVEGLINASRIADVTAIPRQTVNRKLRTLAKDGYIVRRSRGWILNVQDGKVVARQRLEELTANQVETVSRFLAGFDRIRRRKRSTGA